VINFKLGMWPAHIEKGRTLLGHVGQGQRSLKIEIQFLQRNAKRNRAINSKLDMWPAHKEKNFGSCRSRSLKYNLFSCSATQEDIIRSLCLNSKLDM